MKWLLIVVLLWGMDVSVPVIEITIASKELCDRAAAQIKQDLNASAATEALSHYRTGEVAVLTSCLQVAP